MATIAPAYPAKGIRAPGLPVGTRAPPFALPTSPDGALTRSEQLLGAPALLIFYPGDFTPVCSNELAVFNELAPGFQSLGARLFGVSVDSLGSHVAFARELHLRFPCSPTSTPKGRSPGATRSTGKTTASPSGRSSCSTRRGRSPGRRWARSRRTSPRATRSPRWSA